MHGALYVPFLLVRGLRELGHTADNVCFDFEGPTSDLTWGCDYSLRSSGKAILQQLMFFTFALAKYDVFHFWSSPYLVPPCYNLLKRHLPWDLAMIKRLGKRIIFHSDGCFPMIRPSVWKAQVDPMICHICQTTQGDTYGQCSNNNTIRLNEAMNRYADLRFGIGLGLDFEASAEFEFLPIDDTLWHDKLEIPAMYRFERKIPESILIFHSVASHGIGNRGNIKGTRWIEETVRALQNRGYKVELMSVERVPNKVVRFYQAQADIVVDQLVMGGGGANSRECLAVGKPVLTRMHEAQWEPYRKAALPYGLPPYIPTERENLEENLIRLVENEPLRRDIGRQSAEFAKQVLTPIACARRFAAHYEALFQPRMSTR